MKSYEIKRIEPGSVFRFYFTLGLVFGLLAGIFALITGATFRDIGLEFDSFSGKEPLNGGAMITGAILASLASGLMTGVISAVGASIYNIFAAAVGGIAVKLEEKEF